MRRFFANIALKSRENTEPNIEQRPDSRPSSNSDFEDVFNDAFVFSECLTPEFASDPGVWEDKFLRHWSQLRNKFSTSKCDKRILIQVRDSLSSICSFLITEVNSQPEPTIGPILDHFFNEEILLTVHEWAVQLPLHLVPLCQMMLIRTYESLLNRTQSQGHCILVHKPILLPLLRLLIWCQHSSKELKSFSFNVDNCLVQLLNQICRKIAEDSTLLHFFFSNLDDGSNLSPENSVTNCVEERIVEKPFLIFNILVLYLYYPGDIGQLSRDALLLIMSILSKNNDFMSDYIATQSDFCPVIASGLSGIYSQLPRCIYTSLGLSDSSGFHKLDAFDIDLIPELYSFQSALLFCNAVVQVSHAHISKQINQFFYHGFLDVFRCSVVEADPDNLATKVIYFQMILETITEPSLVRCLIKILLLGKSKSRDLNLIEFILSKMNTSERLCRAILSLIHRLIELRCEDFMWSLILRYTVPFIPLKPNCRRFDPSLSLDAASFFLRCIPECARQIEELNSSRTFGICVRKATEQIAEATKACKKWAFKYDGSTPNSLLNLGIPDELLSVRQPFVRLSSARSSYASTGWNRYFQNRSAHGTFDGDLANLSNASTTLNILGEDDSNDDLLFENFGGENELSNFFNSSNSHFDSMNQSCLNYFNFTYEGMSESEESASRKGSFKEDDEDLMVAASKDLSINGSKNNDGSSMLLKARSDVSSNSAEKTPRIPASDFTMAIFNIDWAKSKNREEFISLINSLPAPDKFFSRSTTLEENMALIESRLQYLEELRMERENMKARDCSKSADNPFKLKLRFAPSKAKNELPNSRSGVLLTCTDEKGSGILLECLFEALDRLVNHGLATNMKLLDVLVSLISYPQPVLTSYFLFIDAIRSNSLLRITNVLSDLKTRIDAFAQGTDDFEQLIRRGLTNSMTKLSRTHYDRTVVEHKAPQSQQQPYSLHSLKTASLINRHVLGTNHIINYPSSSSSSSLSLVSTPPSATLRFNNEHHGTVMPSTSSRRFTHRHHTTMKLASSIGGHQSDRDDELRVKNFAYATIVLSQLCQYFAAFALQHYVSLECPKGSRFNSNHSGNNGS